MAALPTHLVEMIIAMASELEEIEHRRACVMKDVRRFSRAMRAIFPDGYRDFRITIIGDLIRFPPTAPPGHWDLFFGDDIP